ncbi:MAG: hypothetical protein B6I22_09590 [Desulfobacteraceae bacterium 4572_123]|nr:MAG: hypothetical protein B6I22_09590 [Desulfobacteraceae bacterium 4572_123]
MAIIRIFPYPESKSAGEKIVIFSTIRNTASGRDVSGCVGLAADLAAPVCTDHTDAVSVAAQPSIVPFQIRITGGHKRRGFFIIRCG